MSRIFELSSSYLVRKSHEEALCTIRSHGRELIMLGRKLHSGTFKTKESRAGLILVPLLCFGSPNVINSVPSGPDRAKDLLFAPGHHNQALQSFYTIGYRQVASSTI